jgi:Protein of unknown function (DUF992)
MSRNVTPMWGIPLITAAVIAALAPCGARGQAPEQKWIQSGTLGCKLNPSIGFVIFGHQSMECRFVPSLPGRPSQIYDGALNTVGIDVGVVGTGGLAWAVLAPTSGVSAGALAGEYVGASGDVALGAGIGANVLIGGSQRSFALQPVSVEGSVALDVTLGLSALKLRYVP